MGLGITLVFVGCTQGLLSTRVEPWPASVILCCLAGVVAGAGFVLCFGLL